jgi:hypothetical protein
MPRQENNATMEEHLQKLVWRIVPGPTVGMGSWTVEKNVMMGIKSMAMDVPLPARMKSRETAETASCKKGKNVMIVENQPPVIQIAPWRLAEIAVSTLLVAKNVMMETAIMGMGVVLYVKLNNK